MADHLRESDQREDGLRRAVVHPDQSDRLKDKTQLWQSTRMRVGKYGWSGRVGLRWSQVGGTVARPRFRRGWGELLARGGGLFMAASLPADLIGTVKPRTLVMGSTRLQAAFMGETEAGV